MSEPRLISEILTEMVIELRRLNEHLEQSERRADELYSPSEASRYLNRTRQTLSSYARRGLLHKVAIAGKTGYRKSELDNIRNL